MTCSRCGGETEGNFCAECGAPLDGARCRGCDAELLAGARFCTRCGTAVRRGPSRIPWLVAGAAVVALVVALAAPRVMAPERDATGAGSFAGQAAPGRTAGGAPPPLTGTPREQADRLFNRVMSARAAGDTAEVSFFAPMAIEAYRRVDDLDADGRFHLSALHEAAGDPAAAQREAERILEGAPDHLLALGAAAAAAVARGDDEASRRHYAHLLEVYDAEIATGRPEYRDHSRMLPQYRDAARAFLGN